MKRKAQISQVFTYLVIILVVGFIVVFGYKGVMSILKANCEHQSISFKQSLLGFINEYSDKGSVHEELMNAPCKVREVCFADTIYYDVSYDPPPPLVSSDIITIIASIDDEVIYSSVETGRRNSTTYNIFVRTKFTEPLGFSNKVALNPEGSPPLPPPYKCFNVRNGKFKFLFTGLGRKTQIESGWGN